MTDQLLYRLNRVPDRLYIKFLELIGVRLLPPTPARSRSRSGCPLRPWRRSRRPARHQGDDDAHRDRGADHLLDGRGPRDRAVRPCRTSPTQAADGERGRPHRRAAAGHVPAFAETPNVGDALVRRADRARAVAARSGSTSAPTSTASASTRPTRRWCGRRGTAPAGTRARSSKDDTGGLNRDGEIFAARARHPRRASSISTPSASAAGSGPGSSRPRRASPPYSSSPMIHGLSAATIGATVEAIHAEIVQQRVAGRVRRRAGPALQRRSLARARRRRRPPCSRSARDDGWEEWTEVADFAASGPDDKHFVLDAVERRGAVRPGRPRGRRPLRQYGAYPPKGA